MNSKLYIPSIAMGLIFMMLTYPQTADASTRIGIGHNKVKVEQPEPKYESKIGNGLRLYLEQSIGQHWSVELALDGDFDIFTKIKAVDIWGLYGKYYFSTTPSSFYVKGGPNHSTYTTNSSRYAEKESGIGVLSAVGWQYQWQSKWAVGLETWYTKRGSDNAMGANISISYGFDWFN